MMQSTFYGKAVSNLVDVTGMKGHWNSHVIVNYDKNDFKWDENGFIVVFIDFIVNHIIEVLELLRFIG